MVKKIEDGCLNLFILFIMSVITVMSWAVIKFKTDFSIQQIIVAAILALIPFAFILFLFLGRKYMKVKVLDPFNFYIEDGEQKKFSEPELLKILQSPFYKLVFGWLSLILIMLLGWILLISFIIKLNASMLGLWSILATISLLLSCLIAFTIGRAYMEDRRKFTLVLSVILTIFLSWPILFPLIFNWKNLSSFYFLGIMFGFLSSLITIKFISNHWNPKLMISIYKTPINYKKDTWREGVFFIFFVIFRILVGLDLIDDSFAIPFLGTWLATTFVYFTIQAIRFRPRPEKTNDLL